MCDRCADIDYPIADPIWLPCGGSADRYTSRSRTGQLPPLTPNRRQSEVETDQAVQIQDLLAIIRRQRTELVKITAQLPPQDSRDSFEGLE